MVQLKTTTTAASILCSLALIAGVQPAPATASPIAESPAGGVPVAEAPAAEAPADRESEAEAPVAEESDTGASAVEAPASGWQPTIDPPTTNLADNPLTAATRSHVGREVTLVPYQPVSTTFDSPDDVADFSFFNKKHHFNKKLHLSPDYAPVHDGVMDITTRRHCLGGGEKPTDNNVSEAPCPVGTTTAYTSARAQTPLIPEGNMRIQIRAKNTTPTYVEGVRPSLWAQSKARFCSHDPNSRYGELDLVEYFSAHPTTQHSASHLGCLGSNHRPEQVMRKKKLPAPMVDSWHTWTVEVFDNQIVYSLDGEVIQGPVGEKNLRWLSPKVFSEVLNQPYRLILDTYLEPDRPSWIPGVKDSDPFPVHHFLIDEILVEQEVDASGAVVQPPRLTDDRPRQPLPGPEPDLSSDPWSSVDGSSLGSSSTDGSAEGSSNDGGILAAIVAALVAALGAAAVVFAPTWMPLWESALNAVGLPPLQRP